MSGHNGTLLRGTSSFGTGKFAQALTSGVYAVTGDVSSTVGTVEAFVKTLDGTNTLVFFGNNGTSNNGLWIGQLDGKAAMGGSGTAFASTLAINDGNYHHVAMTLDGSSQKLWVDGGLKLTATNMIFSTMNFTGGTCAIGGFGASTGFDWTGAIDEIRVSNVVRYTADFTPPTAAFTNDANTTALYHLNGDAVDGDGGVTPGTFSPNATNLYYSPYVWDVTSTRAATINPGAYMKAKFTSLSGTLTLNFDMSNVTSPVPQIKYSFDNGPVTSVEIASSLVLTVPTTGDWTTHTFELAVKSTNEFTNRWDNQQAIVKLTSLVASNTSAALVPVTQRKLKVLVYGDSITEGYKSLSNATTPTGSDATVTWGYLLRETLGAEVGVVGFGGQGFSGPGVGGVPMFTSSYNLLWGSGPARSFTTPVPDIIVINGGENDNTANIVANVTSLLNSLLSATPTTTLIAVMRPFSGREAANLQAGIAACSNPNRVKYIDTTGWWSSADSSDTQHPYGYASISTLSPLLAEQLRLFLGRGASYIKNASGNASLMTQIRK